MRRLLAVEPPLWASALGGALAALLVWRPALHAPAAGLDAGWNAGLAMAVEHGLQFGREIVFSYGPLGFLQSPFVYYSHLGFLALLFTSLVNVCFCIALVRALARVLPLLAAVAVASVMLATLPLIEQPPLLALLAAMALLERERTPRAVDLFVCLGASYAAIECLVKLSTGPVVAAVLLVALIGAGARRSRIVAYLVLLAAGIAGLWLLSGQSLGALPDFLANTREIVSGYSSSMISEPDVASWKVVAASIAAAVTSVVLVAACLLGSYRDRRARWAGVLLSAIVIFALFKEGVVRTDAGHLSLFFSSATVAWIAIPWSRRLWPLLLAGAVAIALAGVPARPQNTPTDFDVVANVRLAGEQAANLFSPSRRGELIDEGRSGLKGLYRLDPQTRAALAGRSVTIEPWEASVAWAYELDWRPLPVFQNYSAYTSGLDRLNAEAVESPGGPERILRENPLLVFPEFPSRDVDRRYRAWDPPEQQRAVLCNFAPLHTTERWQVLGRIGGRCGGERAAGSVEAAEGEAVRVPAPGAGEAVFVRIGGAGVSGLERLATSLFHARTRRLIVDGGRSYRLLPETAADGLLLRGKGGFAAPGPFSPVPQARTIAVTGAGDDLRFEFFRVRVRSVPSASCRACAKQVEDAGSVACSARERPKTHRCAGAGTAGSLPFRTR
jgi:hypothetical protein